MGKGNLKSATSHSVRAPYLSLESLEKRLQLTGIGFAAQSAPQLGFIRDIADLDGDGDLDLISDFSWLENVEGELGEIRTFDYTGDFNARALIAQDFNLDGHVDILVSAWNEESRLGELRLFLNIDGTGRFGGARVIHSTFPLPSLSVADINGDLLPDVLVFECESGSCSVDWIPNAGNGTFSSTLPILERLSSAALRAVDMDGDHDDDLVDVRTATWYENIDRGRTFVEHRSDLSDGRISLSLIGSLDGDGDFDFLIYGHDGLQWLEPNGEGGFSIQRYTAPLDIPSLEQVLSADFDQDGDQDVLIASTEGEWTIMSWSEQNSEGGWSRLQEIGRQHNHRLFSPARAVDINNDGALDVVFERSFILFDKESQSFSAPQQISVPIEDGVAGVADLDGDGDLDLISYTNDRSCSYGGPSCRRTIFWRENRGNGRGLNGDRSELFSVDWRDTRQSEYIDSRAGIFVTDVDGDGDQDFLYAVGFDFHRQYAPRIVWLENLDGRGRFSAEQSLNSRGRLLALADLDNDGQDDLISATAEAIYVSWVGENGPLASVESTQVLQDDGRNQGLRVIDWDNDGDLDIVAIRSVGHQRAELVWFELDNRRFLEARSILTREGSIETNSLGPRAIGAFEVIDLDGDGDIDIIDRHHRNQLALLENQTANGEPDSWIERDLIISAIVDFDRDGNVDYVSQGTLYINEGQNQFSPIATSIPTRGHFADLDGDGDLDIAVSGRTWLQNRPVGDANNDGSFSSADIVKMMQAGRFEDDVTANGTFDTGDWNGDREVTSEDLVFALAVGNYVG